MGEGLRAADVPAMLPRGKTHELGLSEAPWEGRGCDCSRKLTRLGLNELYIGNILSTYRELEILWKMIK